MLYKIKISPESFSEIVKTVDYEGNSVGVYTTVSEALTGKTGNDPIITSFEVPIFLKHNYIDFGYYSEFDGAILQKETVLNFVFSALTDYDYIVFNTTNKTNTFLKESNYVIDWGDGVEEELIGEPIVHTYSYNAVADTIVTYTITIRQVNNFGTNIITKNIVTPFDPNKISDNPNGTAEFIPSGGPWKDTPINYDYIFSGDSLTIDDYINSEPVMVSGYTYSKLKELSSYGPEQYKEGKSIYKDNILFGKIDTITSQYTAYTIQDIIYVDYSNGLTTFSVETSGLTADNTILNIITKEDVLLKSVNSAQIYSNVFIERGKVSGYEKVLRLGEVKTIEDLENYGYGYFNLVNK
jgi:hypothetical protein